MKTNGNGTVEIHGKVYETVALRVKKLRENPPLPPPYTIKTTIERLDEDMCVMRAEILAIDGRLIANGHAQEFRQSSQINKTSYVENCETSAIGRALASFGLGGTEFATADEVAHAISGGKPEPHGKATPRAGFFASLSADMQTWVTDKANRVRACLHKDDERGAWAELTEGEADMDENTKAALWDRFDSTERSRLTKIGTNQRKAA